VTHHRDQTIETGDAGFNSSWGLVLLRGADARCGRSSMPETGTLGVNLRAHTVRNATVGGIRDARTAGIRPANAPIKMAEATPPDHASTGITTAQPFTHHHPRRPRRRLRNPTLRGRRELA
jgi:hypothetical protein